jgi:hypothetical protein
MTRYITSDGQTFEARDPVHLVNLMHQRSFGQFDFAQRPTCHDMGERMKLLDIKVHIDTRSPERYVNGLIKSGFLKIKS